jgi:hypothetical protein
MAPIKPFAPPGASELVSGHAEIVSGQTAFRLYRE